MSKKLRVGVLMGGPSSEREVSLVTGRAVYDNLDRKKYLPTLIEMTKQNQFFILDGKKRKHFNFELEGKKLFDIIFIALHGSPGEDGRIQGMFEVLGIPYTGSRVLPSATAMNKLRTAEVYRAHGLPTPLDDGFIRSAWKKHQAELVRWVKKDIGFPAVVKPVDQGSAVGVHIVKNENELVLNVNKEFKLFEQMMVQKFIKGQEATCGVLEKNGEPFALPPTHILPNFDEFYDYRSKYKPGGSTHVCPADFSAKINRDIQALALKAHKALDCRGMSRTDVMVEDDGGLWVLETNTIPGMTPTSLLPEAAEIAGINFSVLLDLIIKASL